MGTKRTPALLAEAKRLQSEGRSVREIASMLSKKGKTISHMAVQTWLKSAATSATAAPASTPPVAVPPPAASAAPAARLGDSDDREAVDIGPDELRALLAGELRRHQAEAERAMEDGRPGDARQSSRLVAAFTSQLQRIHARADEDVETVRVKVSDMASAGERAVAVLRTVADAVAAERAGWPRCSGCGQPVGAFAGADVSVVRALFERACAP